jgi:hypothetical protein
MLNALSRLFTARLQATGFTCGMDDLLLTPAAEASRSQVGSCPQGLECSTAQKRSRQAANTGPSRHVPAMST